MHSPSGDLKQSHSCRAWLYLSAKASAYQLSLKERGGGFQAIRSSPLICARCMRRREVGSKGSRLCSTERLFHISRSPTCHSWHIMKRRCVACSHKASSKSSL